MQLTLWAKNFYPRPLRGGRLYDVQVPNIGEVISIHALCEEGDAPHTGAALNR